MQEQEVEGEPAHHARRPMNAFLIFCKRHRGVVRDKYPNLENRSITKILGEWWANLEKEEKACYTGLAKQYKDAFFSANPDFKWYKLPAPPLRSLSSRPRDHVDKHSESHSDFTDVEMVTTNNNSTKVDLNNRHGFENRQSMFTVGKLADEADMGGLSSLIEKETENPTINPYFAPYSFNSYSTDKRSHDNMEKPKKHEEELQNALSETANIFIDESKNEKQESGRIIIVSDSIESCTTIKSSSSDNHNTINTFKAADFDLEAKIKALPSLSLEKFQQRKRDNKRRKKTINLRPKALAPSQIINSVPRPIPVERRELAESWREHAVGSQKRKPRKKSITRLDINSLASTNFCESVKISPEIKIATEAPCTVVHTMDMCNQTIHGNVDLFALATLAEVASNTSKIEDTAKEVCQNKRP
ncbi:uncharacterized protein LOC126964533 [Leptidea sinapis]|uniref:uncharacterized protein LOC126964533 n=1 Tax=Leptidea sinapis TaxID=189913 RepID=UPI00212E2EAF|nr:uncharacterized protein LOC126964533 [Leptidea sinapis]